MKNLKILIVLIMSITIFSCNESDESIEKLSIEENEISSLLSFKSIDFDELSTSKKWCGHIVSWDEWGRKRKNCGGWGLCNASWFESCPQQVGEGEEKNIKNKIQKLKSSNGFATKVYVEDSSGRNFIILPLKTALPPTIDIDDISLKIDEDIVLKTENSSLGRNLTFRSGVYQFNRDIDEFGGYKIYLN